jgi:hypothetical protein
MEADGLVHTSMGHGPPPHSWVCLSLGGLGQLMGYDGLRSNVPHSRRWYRRDECMCQEMFYEWICQFQGLDQFLGCNLEIELSEQGF